MIYHIVTIFPEMFDSYLNESILGRAQEEGQISVTFHDPRDYANDKHNRVDSPPYGGGPGMVMKAQPILDAIDDISFDTDNVGVVIFTPAGNQFTNDAADDLIDRYDELVFICGRYEGMDARVQAALCSSIGCDVIHEMSIGPYVLTGGELPAMVLMDATTRRIPGVLGNDISIEEEREASSRVFTRPETIEYNGNEYTVPEVLLSGDHAKIEEWRKEH